MNRPWSPRRRRRLAARALKAGVSIRTTLHERCLHEGAAVVWGQYLDEYHRSENQWGIYGTSAALQTLAMHARDAPTGIDAEPLIGRAMPMPTSRTTFDGRLQPKVEKGDLNNVVKLAFIAEALDLGSVDVPTGKEPELIHDIVDLAVTTAHWSSRLEDDEERSSRDQEFPTAIVLCALQKYEWFRRQEHWATSREWLGRQVTGLDGLNTPTMFALTGLAILGEPSSSNSTLEKFLREIDDFLVKWANAQKRISLDRPVYNGFAIDDTHDYIFLHPELLTTAYFMKRHVRSGRKFVLRVVETLCDNVSKHQAFEGQTRTVSTLDQLWAMRVLAGFDAAVSERFFPMFTLPHWASLRRRPRWLRHSLAAVVAAGCVYAGAAVDNVRGALLGFLFALAVGVIAWLVNREIHES